MKYVLGIGDENSEFKEFSEGFALDGLLKREFSENEELEATVRAIGKDVRGRGDSAVRELTEKLDGARLENFAVTPEEFARAETLVEDDVKAAIETAISNVEKFHMRQKPADSVPEDTAEGVSCWREFRAIERVGLYAPGGTAALFSTVIMLAVPAKIAGCREIALCTPPNSQGEAAPAVLYTAKRLGITEVYKIGGAQAVFAMGSWTESVNAVDKIFWPGNSFVTEAKNQVSKFCAIDMPAGPSEVLVIADRDADAAFVASDLLSQCEHGKDSQAVLVSDCREKIRETLAQVRAQAAKLSRTEFVESSMKKSFAVLVDDLDEAVEVSNAYAPEHLILQISDWKKHVREITNAGSVFCGAYSPESAGDYCSGTNHTLPTSGFAKSFSGVGVESFGKWVTFQNLSRKGLAGIAGDTVAMARKEGLDGHANAVTVRMGA